MADSLLLYIWLNSIQSLSPAKRLGLLEYFGSIEKLYNADKGEYIEYGLKEDAASLRALCTKELSFASEEKELADEMGVRLIPIGSPDYPEALTEIYDPPVLLYAMGDITLLQEKAAFCIVGARHSSQYGISAASAVASELAECGMTVVSGLAMGIDSAAHKGALRVRGKTIGIAGCGLSVNYPPGNKALRLEIAEKGLIISEFPLKTGVYAGNFPQRNRILSGLSLGVAVIEAGAISGALITARYAWEQNKDVFALPGNVTSPNSVGTNGLIADGAEVLLGADTVLAGYIVRYPELFKTEKKKTEEVKPFSEEAYETAAHLSGEETDKKILELLRSGAMHVDDIAYAAGEEVSKINARLIALQIKRLVTERPGRIYEIK